MAPEVHYCIHNSPPPVPTLSQIKPVHATRPTFWRSTLILSSHLYLGLPSGLFPSGFPTKTLNSPLFSPHMCYVPAHPILLNLITQVLYGEEYISVNSSLRSFLHSPATSSLIRLNILLSTLFSNTLSLHSSLSVSDQVSHPYKTIHTDVLHIFWHHFF